MAVRINVTLSDRNHEELRIIAKKMELDMSQYVRNALYAYTKIQQELEKGRQLYIGKDENIIKELILPSN
jgi:hypothetical protein